MPFRLVIYVVLYLTMWHLCTRATCYFRHIWRKLMASKRGFNDPEMKRFTIRTILTFNNILCWHYLCFFSFNTSSWCCVILLPCYWPLFNETSDRFWNVIYWNRISVCCAIRSVAVFTRRYFDDWLFWRILYFTQLFRVFMRHKLGCKACCWRYFLLDA